ncbi:MAG: Adaptive-response sensory-kinase SasA [Myxococcota bacterium]|nr:Adaptive-response sensory-kinase SasA [Myxococcota bacterium]
MPEARPQNPDGHNAAAVTLLEPSYHLRDLIKADLARELCACFQSIAGVPIRLLDAEGEPFADTSLPDSRVSPGAGEEAAHYFPVELNGDLVGTVVIGPYAKSDRLSQPVDQLGKVIAQAFENILFQSAKSAMTQTMHLDTMAASHAEVDRKTRELKQAYLRLAELDRAKSSFLSTVSHELKTPLTSIMGYSELLTEGVAGPLNDEQRNYLQIVLTRGKSLLQMINGLLEVTRTDSAALEFSTDPVRLQDLVLAAVNRVQAVAAEKRIEIEMVLPESIPPLSADRRRMTEAITFILDNAVKFSRNGGKIRVTIAARKSAGASSQGGFSHPFLKQSHDSAVVTVEDQGVGIREEDIPHIFEAFYQADSSTTREHGGAGLGLVLARGIVRAHGGEIEVESQVEKGSKFSIVLPLAGPQG